MSDSEETIVIVVRAWKDAERPGTAVARLQRQVIDVDDGPIEAAHVADIPQAISVIEGWLKGFVDDGDTSTAARGADPG